MVIPTDPNALLTRRETAAALTASGYRVAAQTLAVWVVRGGGPQFRKFGQRTIYRWGDALEWAQSRLSPPIRTSTDLRRMGAMVRK